MMAPAGAEASRKQHWPRCHGGLADDEPTFSFGSPRIQQCAEADAVLLIIIRIWISLVHR